MKKIMKVKVFDAKNKDFVVVELEEIANVDYTKIIESYDDYLETQNKAKEVTNAYLFTINQCPKANPADLRGGSGWLVDFSGFINEYHVAGRRSDFP